MKRKARVKAKFFDARKLIIPILAVFCISTAAYAVGASVNTGAQQAANSDIISGMSPESSEHITPDISNIMQQNNIQLPAGVKGRIVKSDNYEDWLQDEGSSSLIHEEELALYNQGYDFLDIAEAEHISMISGKTPREVLEMKGKASFETEKQVDGTAKIIKKESMTWHQVMDSLGVKDQSVTEVLGVSAGQISDMKKQGLSDAEIQEASALAFNYKKDYKDILKEVKGGKKIKDLQKKYWEEREKKLKTQIATVQENQADNEKILKNQFNISDSDIALCKQNNITSIYEIAYAKDMAIKHNVKLEKVLAIKKQYKDWNKVKDLFGGDKE